MKRCNEGQPVKFEPRCVPEFRFCGICNSPRFAERIHRRFKANLTQSDNNADIFQQSDFFQKKWLAVENLLRGWLVERRCTAECCSDVAIGQRQSVTAVKRFGLIGETGFVQRPEKPVAAVVACEHASRPVAAVCRRRETDEQEAGIRIAEARDRFGPVFFIRETLYLFSSDALTPSYKTRTRPTSYDILLQSIQCS